MFGIQSLKDMHDWAHTQFGPRVASALSWLVLLAIVAVCLTVVGGAVALAFPTIRAVWSFLPGGQPVSISWERVLPGAVGFLVVNFVLGWSYFQFSKFTKRLDIVTQRIYDAVEARLQTIETESVSARQDADEADASVEDQLASLRGRVTALEHHTDVHGLAALLAERALEDKAAVRKAILPDTAKANAIIVDALLGFNSPKRGGPERKRKS